MSNTSGALTPEQTSHLQRVTDWFTGLLTPKYIAGQREHGGNLWEKPGLLANIKEELVDLVTYVQTLEEQMARVPGGRAWLLGTEVPKRRPRIYVAGPYSAETSWEREEHIRTAAVAARDIWTMGGAAFCPHLNTRYMDGPGLTWDDFIDGDLAWLTCADAVYFLWGWADSGGAQLEYAEAQRLGIPCYETLADLQSYVRKVGTP